MCFNYLFIKFHTTVCNHPCLFFLLILNAALTLQSDLGENNGHYKERQKKGSIVKSQDGPNTKMSRLFLLNSTLLQNGQSKKHVKNA